MRSNAVKALLDLDVDIIITDDGLQHYALGRDIELVIVDGNRRFGNESLIPLGPLREGIERLKEVDFIITNGGQAHTGEIAMALAPSKAINLKTKQHVDVSELKDLVAFAGIGHPPRFFHTLNSMNADVKVTKGFADHQDFDQQELEALAQQGTNVIMTEKDAVKCSHYAQDNWWYLPVSAQFESNDAEQILNRIKEVKAAYGSPST